MSVVSAVGIAVKAMSGGQSWMVSTLRHIRVWLRVTRDYAEASLRAVVVLVIARSFGMEIELSSISRALHYFLVNKSPD